MPGIVKMSAAMPGIVKMSAAMPHWVYIVRCNDGSLYTGYAKDPAARLERHNTGKGAKYTSGRRPVTLVFTQKFRSLSRALKREHELKQWTRAQKEALLSASR